MSVSVSVSDSAESDISSEDTSDDPTWVLVTRLMTPSDDTASGSAGSDPTQYHDSQMNTPDRQADDRVPQGGNSDTESTPGKSERQRGCNS